VSDSVVSTPFGIATGAFAILDILRSLYLLITDLTFQALT